MKIGLQLIDLIRGTNILQRFEELKNPAGSKVRTSHSIRLAQLLKEIKSSNAFYRPILEKFSNEVIDKNPLDVLSSLPIMDKKTISSHYKEIFTPLKNRPVQQKKTGGSTGTPFYYYVDKEHLSWFWGYIYHFWNLYSGYKPGDLFVTIAGNSLRTTKKRLLEKTYHFLQNNYFITGDIIDETLQIDYNKTRKAILLYGYPSSILNIIKTKPEVLNHFSGLKAVFTTSEQLLPASRKSIEAAFKVPIYDMYGANDGGILTCECSQHTGYHINELNCYVETFINEHGLSELLLTNLNSYSFPFIRYRVGDLGKLESQPCQCGENSPRIVELKGRTRDMILLPGGKSIHGSFFNTVFYKYPGIDGYRIVQNKDLSIVLHIHTIDPEDYKEVSALVYEDIQKAVKGAKITIEFMTDLNPTNDKFKLIESHVL